MKSDRNSGCRFLYYSLLKHFPQIIHTYLCPILGDDEFSGESWWPVTAIYNEGGGMLLD
jgi:hypothetical protein